MPFQTPFGKAYWRVGLVDTPIWHNKDSDPTSAGGPMSGILGDFLVVPPFLLRLLAAFEEGHPQMTDLKDNNPRGG